MHHKVLIKNHSGNNILYATCTTCTTCTTYHLQFKRSKEVNHMLASRHIAASKNTFASVLEKQKNSNEKETHLESQKQKKEGITWVLCTM